MAGDNEKIGNILVLDDEKMNVDIVKNSLNVNYNVYYALKHGDAFNILKRIKIDLLLLDVMMPEMDGFEFCRIIKADESLKNIPVIFITGKNDTESVVKGFEEGAVDYLTKPVEVKELEVRVKTQMELLKTKRQLEGTNRELIKLNATKDRLFSIIGHDLRGPVGGIDSLLQFLLDTDDMGLEETRVYIKQIKSYASFATGLLENLLNWAITQEKQSALRCEKFNLNDIITQCQQVLSMAADLKNITVKNAVDKDITVEADKNMIMTVIRNLLSNGIKFTRPQGEVVIEAAPGEGVLTVKVSDNGVGIETENLDKIFNTAKENSTAGTAGEQGTGLGLFLCRELIEKHKGRILVESEPGKGSRFIFTIPQANT
ncbi:MAG: Phytochrome-like protein cph1 [bacterium ADurb.Bin243]|nr:MAG: Phytochrome-like protein cph1 [bacterium ADurb.Bin243]HOD39656.1 hybrid sensor histidine kinase/response regulator [Candidatus Wallbacteria bacterium]